MQQTFTIPLQDQTKFELKSKSQELSPLKGENLPMIIGGFPSLPPYFSYSASGGIQQC